MQKYKKELLLGRKMEAGEMALLPTFGV